MTEPMALPAAYRPRIGRPSTSSTWPPASGPRAAFRAERPATDARCVVGRRVQWADGCLGRVAEGRIAPGAVVVAFAAVEVRVACIDGVLVPPLDGRGERVGRHT